MNSRDLISAMLQAIDSIEKEKQAKNAEERATKPSRFRQIYDILAQKDQEKQYGNSPEEIVTGIDSVTKDAGGGVNGPKHPADIRVKDPRGFE